MFQEWRKSEVSSPPLNLSEPIRESHLKHIAEYIKSGHFVLGGAFTDVSGAALLFKADTEDPVYQFVKNVRV